MNTVRAAGVPFPVPGTAGEGQTQVENFMQVNQISMPPESVASLPITTFEDTQQMLRAYKKKKREILKLKEQIFTMDTEFMKMK